MSREKSSSAASSSRPCVWVVVLGDFGRSPRMQYHALSLAELARCDVHVLAYGGSRPLEAVANHRHIKIHHLPDPPAWTSFSSPSASPSSSSSSPPSSTKKGSSSGRHRSSSSSSSSSSPRASGGLVRVLALVIKALLQLFSLLWATLWELPRPRAGIIVQTPPALPTLPALAVAARMRGCGNKLVVDWHNFAFTIMALQMGRRHPLVQLAQRFERFWGSAAAANLCVTHAMRRELQGPRWKLRRKVITFHDRPPAHFRAATAEQRHALLSRLSSDLSVGQHSRDCCAGAAALVPDASVGEPEGKGVEATLLTLAVRNNDGGEGGVGDASVSSPTASATYSYYPRPRRPALVVSSTSWTPDEDFGVLLEAATVYDAMVASERKGASVADGAANAAAAAAGAAAGTAPSSLPDLLVVVTGKGPSRARYERLMAKSGLRHVAFRTLWLEAADYPTLLGSADVGVSLHTSSSGLDLPMKVVDMFGAGLPVLAAGFPALPELVAHGANGLVFNSAQELARQLAEVLSGLGAARRRGGGAGVGVGVGVDSGSSAQQRRRRSSSSSPTTPILSPIPGGALGYGDEPPALARLRKTVAAARSGRDGGWETAWARTVAPLFGGVK